MQNIGLKKIPHILKAELFGDVYLFVWNTVSL